MFTEKSEADLPPRFYADSIVSEEHFILFRIRKSSLQHFHMGHKRRIIEIFCILRALMNAALALDAGTGHI